MKYAKTMVFAAAAALAITAFVGVASASAFTNFNAESVPATVSGEQSEASTFTTSAGTISCTGGKFMGVATSTPTSTVTTDLSYSGCTFLGFINVEVKPNKCHYTFLATGTANVSGCEGTSIEFEAAGCLVKVGEQTGLTSIGYANAGEGAKRTVIVTPAVTNIKYTTSASCPGGAQSNSTGKYEKGKTTVKGFVGVEGTTQEGVFMT